MVEKVLQCERYRLHHDLNHLLYSCITFSKLSFKDQYKWPTVQYAPLDNPPLSIFPPCSVLGHARSCDVIRVLLPQSMDQKWRKTG
eukprot:scaffold141662_cov35-Attheya_sp.AAC.1